MGARTLRGRITLGTGLRDDADVLVVAPSVKLRRDHRLGNDANAWLSGITGRRVVPMLNKAFQFQVSSMQHYRVGAYAADRGDFFTTHRDNDTPTTEDRCFAMSINLNDDYEGGAVCFPGFGNELHRPPMGEGLIFSCSLLHEALPVSRGTRFVALTFFFSARATK
jgi:predicted 2-oxoglutarate/Fe(II)-dependent dioxygenase YbiX